MPSGEVIVESGEKPADIPSKPDYTYAETGWSSWGDWLGTGRIADQLREYWPFMRARRFVRGLGLQSQAEWYDYCASGKKPLEIPSNPSNTYAGKGWVGVGDWLGTGTVAPFLRQYRSFKKARAFARSLGLNSVADWDKFLESGKKPTDIPSNPDHLIRRMQLGRLGRFARHWPARGSGWRIFKEARAFVCRLGLKSKVEWHDYCRSGKKPADVPAAPWLRYADDGWAGMGDWFGTGRHRGTGWRTFKKARAFARSLGLITVKEWTRYCKLGKKPSDIPADPNGVYGENGWHGWGDWLGTGKGRVAGSAFKKARAYARRLGLKSNAEWLSFCNSGKNAADIPSSPEYVYANKGWTGRGDWLGTGTVANRLRQYRLFQEARSFVPHLGLKSRDDWNEYCNSGEKPADIPAAPEQTYADDGWSDLADWLGTWQAPWARAGAVSRMLAPMCATST